MEHVPARPQAHLVVAAVRVLQHQLGRPPAIEEVAEILRQSKELTGHLVRALEACGIVHTIKSPFDVRVEVRDHLEVEKLPLEETGPGLEDEVEEFHKRFQKKQEALQNLFDSGELDQKKKQKHESLDDELRNFKAPRRSSPFADEPGETP
jgi:DNA-binding transcriptional regulator GbsR (MarR family)